MASRLKTGVHDLQERGVASVRSAKAQYDASGRFAQMRFWILVLFFLDLSGTVGYVVGAAQGAAAYHAWFQRGFPADMVVVDNATAEVVEDVVIVLDGRWRLRLKRLEVGPNGFEISRDFRDASNQAPAADYKPRQVVLHVDRDAHELTVEDRSGQ